MKSLHITIHGRVQGVGFRAWTEGEAVSRGLAGWARNRRGGTVEVVIAGEADAVAGMLEALRQGPRSANVSRLEIEDWAGPVGSDFELLPTA